MNETEEILPVKIHALHSLQHASTNALNSLLWAADALCLAMNTLKSSPKYPP